MLQSCEAPLASRTNLTKRWGHSSGSLPSEREGLCVMESSLIWINMAFLMLHYEKYVGPWQCRFVRTSRFFPTVTRLRQPPKCLKNKYIYIYIWYLRSNIPVNFFDLFWAFGMKPGVLALSLSRSVWRAFSGGAKWRGQDQMVQVFEVVAIRHLPPMVVGGKGEVKGWVPRRLKVLGICYP